MTQLVIKRVSQQQLTSKQVTAGPLEEAKALLLDAFRTRDGHHRNLRFLQAQQARTKKLWEEAIERNRKESGIDNPSACGEEANLASEAALKLQEKQDERKADTELVLKLQAELQLIEEANARKDDMSGQDKPLLEGSHDNSPLDSDKLSMSFVDNLFGIQSAPIAPILEVRRQLLKLYRDRYLVRIERYKLKKDHEAIQDKIYAGLDSEETPSAEKESQNRSARLEESSRVLLKEKEMDASILRLGSQLNAVDPIQEISETELNNASSEVQLLDQYRRREVLAANRRVWKTAETKALNSYLDAQHRNYMRTGKKDKTCGANLRDEANELGKKP